MARERRAGDGPGVKTSFVNKSFAHVGDEIGALNSARGCTCRKGLKPESPHQDSWPGLKVDGNFSIYDGHGQQGHDISHFVKKRSLPDRLRPCRRCRPHEEAQRADVGDVHGNAGQLGTAPSCLQGFAGRVNLQSESERMHYDAVFGELSC